MTMSDESIHLEHLDATVEEIKAFSIRWFKKTLRKHQIEWLYFILSSGDRCHLESPRRHGKSIVLRVYMLWLICKNPEIRILVIANTESLSAAIIRHVQRIIENNADEMLELYGIAPGKPWRATEMCFDKIVEHADAALMGKATSAKVTGLSTDVILMDDVVTVDSIRTAQQYRRLIEWIIGELWNTLDPMLEKVIILGTRKGITDWYSELLQNPDIDCRVDAAILEDGTPLWPKEPTINGRRGRGFTIEGLEKKRRLNPELFAREWMNQPSLPSGYRFNREWIKEYTQLPPSQFLDHYLGIDPGHGLGDRASFFALVVIAHDTRNDNVYIVEMYRDKIDLELQIEKAQELYNKYQVKQAICESVFAYSFLADQFQKKLPQLRKVDIMHEGLKGTDVKSKEGRIESRLVPLYRAGWIHTRNPDIDHFTKIFNERELLQFGGGGTGGTQGNSEMDLLDALVYALDEIEFDTDDDDGPIAISVTARSF